jgi:uncharacterized protein YdbL (DUF1318 family)
MIRLLGSTALATIALSACVTINVYFPAAEAREAAKEFVEQVIDVVPPAGGGGMAVIDEAPAVERGLRFDPLALIGIGSAHAQGQPDFNIQTPAITAIQARMEQRFDATLRPHFDSGALGFTEDGLVAVRDAAAIPLKDRVPVNTAVADENRDRKAVYREIAVANGHPEWEGQIRSVFAKQWVSSAKPGWWYQQGGAWKQK